METRIEEYTVGELARAAGVSVRTLHHYDAIGLIKPAHVASNGYRIYRHAEALQLQEVLFYRAAGIPLREISFLMNESDTLQRLSAHRERLAQGLADQAEMLATLDRTIAHLVGETPMTIEDLYKPFSTQKQAEYEKWLADTYGQEMANKVAKSKVHLGQRPEGFLDGRLERLEEIETALVASYEAGTPTDSVDLSAHQDWVAEMWGQPCDANAYGGLSEVYLAHPDFIARFETLSKGFSQWLAAAMIEWAKRQQ